MRREGVDIARCTVERLMRDLGLQGVIRGKSVRTTVSDKAAPCPLGQVNRQFHAPAPKMLWVSDFTYVLTWAGFVYAALSQQRAAWKTRPLRVRRSRDAPWKHIRARLW